MTKLSKQIFTVSAAFLIGAVLLFGLGQIFIKARSLWVDPILKIFDLESNPSWKVIRPSWGNPSKALTRVGSQGEQGRLVLSHQTWRNFELSSLIANPFQCGVVFDYRDGQNFRYFYYRQNDHRLISGIVAGGQTRILNNVAANIEGLYWPLTFHVYDGQAKIYFDQKLMAQQYVDEKPARFGLIYETHPAHRTFFMNLSLSGVQDDGKMISIPREGSKGWITRKAVLLYLLLCAVIVFIRRIWSMVFKRKAVHQTQIEFYFTLACFAAGGFCFVLLARLLSQMVWVNFYDSYSWEVLGKSLSVYAGVGFFAYLYSRVFKSISVSTFFIGIFFFIYFLVLINMVTIKMSGFGLGLLSLGMLLAPVVYKIIKGKVILNDSKGRWKFSLLDGLVILWLVHSVLYLLDKNFDPFRIPQSDEINLWFVAAQNMIQKGIYAAHLAQYNSGLIHSLGVPFVSALPSMIWGGTSVEMIYFMPLVTILALTFFLSGLKSYPWRFLFFYFSLLLVVNNSNWMSELLYALLYGDALGTVFFLFIIHEMFKFLEQGRIARDQYWLMSLILGLLSLTKGPASYFGPVFYIIFLVQMRAALKEKCSVGSMAWGIIVFFAPVVFWKILTYQNHIGFNNAMEHLTRAHVHAYRTELVQNMIQTMKSFHGVTIAWCVVSLGLIAMTFSKREWWLVVPMLILIAGMFPYYGYLYGQGDYISSVRYVMPSTLAIFYLGAVGFERLVNRGQPPGTLGRGLSP